VLIGTRPLNRSLALPDLGTSPASSIVFTAERHQGASLVALPLSHSFLRRVLEFGAESIAELSGEDEVAELKCRIGCGG
jgi:hypothetical protein